VTVKAIAPDIVYHATEMRSWVQILPPGPLFPVVQLQY